MIIRRKSGASNSSSSDRPKGGESDGDNGDNSSSSSSNRSSVDQRIMPMNDSAKKSDSNNNNDGGGGDAKRAARKSQQGNKRQKQHQLSKSSHESSGSGSSSGGGDDDDDNAMNNSSPTKKNPSNHNHSHNHSHSHNNNNNTKSPPDCQLCKYPSCQKYRQTKCDGYCITHYHENNKPSPSSSSNNGSSRDNPHVVKVTIRVEDTLMSEGFRWAQLINNNNNNNNDGRKRMQSRGALLPTCPSSTSPPSFSAAGTTATFSPGKKSSPHASKICIWEGCERYKQTKCDGYCIKHYNAAHYEEEEEEEGGGGGGGAYSSPEAAVMRSLLMASPGSSSAEGMVATSDGGGGKEVTVRVRVEKELLEENCLALLQPQEKRREPSSSAARSIKMEHYTQASTATAATATGTDYAPVTKDVPHGVHIFASPQIIGRKKICRVMGCKKQMQTNNDGFCRTHYNSYSAISSYNNISTSADNNNDGDGNDGDGGGDGFWTCQCGQPISLSQARCGKCFRWKGGKRAPYSSGSSEKKSTSNDEDKKKQVVSYASEISSMNVVDSENNAVGILGDYWTCECGESILSHKKRCGKCNRWKGGKREQIFMTSTSSSAPVLDDCDGDTWTCSCGEMIPSRKTRCGKCHHWRGGKRDSKGWTYKGPSEADEEAADDEDDGEDWTCDCGEVVDGRKSRCGKCHHWRGGRRKMRWTNKASSGPGSKSSNRREDDPQWKCRTCNESNLGGRKRCSECMAWRHSRKKIPSPRSDDEDDDYQGDSGDDGTSNWRCKSCSFHNFPTEINCIMCQATRPNTFKNMQHSSNNNILNQNNALPQLGNSPVRSMPYDGYNHNFSNVPTAALATGANAEQNYASYYDNNLHNYAGIGSVANATIGNVTNSNYPGQFNAAAASGRLFGHNLHGFQAAALGTSSGQFANSGNSAYFANNALHALNAATASIVDNTSYVGNNFNQHGHGNFSVSDINHHGTDHGDESNTIDNTNPSSGNKIKAKDGESNRNIKTEDNAFVEI